MSGYTDDVMRQISLSWGADFAYSPMLSSSAIVRKDPKCLELLPVSPAPIQLFGRDPLELAEAAAIVEDRATWIDLNAACPVRKVTRKGAGAALLNEPALITIILQHLKDRINLPVSVKMRLGWSDNLILQIVDHVCMAKPDMLVIHGRTAEQGYSGRADWRAIDAVAHHVRDSHILVLGSGDLFSPEDIARSLRTTSVDGAVVARGAIGNPWIFAQAKEFVRTGNYLKISFEERLGSFLHHLRALADKEGERRAIRVSRKLFSGYTRDVPHATKLRRVFMKLESLEQIQVLLSDLINARSSIV